jgi:hypothetical protein
MMHPIQCLDWRFYVSRNVLFKAFATPAYFNGQNPARSSMSDNALAVAGGTFTTMVR